MKSNYQRVHLVLEALEKKCGVLVGASLDLAVKAQLAALSASYPHLTNPKRSPIDYSAPEMHVAYAFRCLAAHGDLLNRTLSAASERVLAALESDPVKVACIGGGPGSDALGVIKFAERHGLSDRTFEFIFLDREPAWEAVRAPLFDTFGKIKTSRGFLQIDLASGAPWTEDWSFASADLFTLSFALSEVWCFDGAGSVSGFLNRLFDSAKPGALFAYTDNGGDSFLPRMEKVISARKDVEELYSYDDTWMLIGSDEQQSTIGEYCDRFSQETKKTGNVNRRLWRKLK